MGLVGVGIATLGANFLYFLLSIIIVLPGLRLVFPKLIMGRMVISFVPFVALYYVFDKFIHLPALVEMLSLISVFYICYFTLTNTIMKRPEL